MIQGLLNRKRTSAPVGAGVPDAEFDYQAQKRLLSKSDVAARLLLAEHTDTRPEILYYLAGDPSPEVRRAVAANAATPLQADELLVDDADEEVRRDLAMKIARLLPDMPADEQQKVRDLTFQMLRRLAGDQLPRVRAMLSEELKESRDVPRDVVRALALDVAIIVAAPILEYSPLLSDADLLEVIAAGCARESLDAIARRATVSEAVSEAVVATFDVPAVANLLANPNARVRAEALEQVAEGAAEVEAWHQPLVMRPELSVRAIRRIAGFVATSLLEILAQRNDLDAETARQLTERVKARIDESQGEVQEEEREQARELDQRDLLDEEALAGAIENGRQDFVLEALAMRSGLALPTVGKLLRSANAKTVTALAWKANLSMRLAMRLQSRSARIPPQKMLNARHGTEYPLTAEEMQWQLEIMT
jgi:uncharacterized protein (DUF2336 family)